MRSISLAAVGGLLLGFFDIRPAEAASSYHLACWYSAACMASAAVPARFLGDFDGDGDVDQEDFGHLQACFTGPDVIQDAPSCLNARLDEDQDVDTDDFGLFQPCLSGANEEPVPDCLVPVTWTDDPVEAAKPATYPVGYWSDAYYNPSNPTGKIIGWNVAAGTGGNGLREKLSVWDGTTRTTLDFDAAFYPTSPANAYVVGVYGTPVALFVEGRNGNDLVLSRIKSWSDTTLTRCTTDGGNFGVNMNVGGHGGGLARTLCYVPATTDWVDGVVLYFQYDDHANKVLYSTDKGDTWTLLFTTTSAIRHFHGARFVPATAQNGLTGLGRLYVFTGDGPHCCALFFCDDVDDLIANPVTWKTRWGLDGGTADTLVPDPSYCMNDNLTGPGGSPANTKFRMVDLAENGGDSIVWSQDGMCDTSGPLWKTNQTTKVTTAIGGSPKVYGSSWNSVVRSDGTILWFTASEITIGPGFPDEDEYRKARCYAIRKDLSSFTLVRSWRRPNDAGNLLPSRAFEAFGRVFISFAGLGEKRADDYNYGYPQNVHVINATYLGQPFFAGALNTVPETPVLTELLTGGIPQTITAPWAVAGGYSWHTHEASDEGTVGRVLVVEGTGALNRAYLRQTDPSWRKKWLTLSCRMKLAQQTEGSRTAQTAYLYWGAATASGVKQTFTTNGFSDGDFDGVWKDYQFTTYGGESYYVEFWCCNNYSGSVVPNAAEMYVTDIRIVEGLVPKPRTE